MNSHNTIYDTAQYRSFLRYFMLDSLNFFFILTFILYIFYNFMV